VDDNANDDDVVEAVNILSQNDDDDVEDDNICPKCACSPCEWDGYSPYVHEQDRVLFNRHEEVGVEVILDNFSSQVSNATMQFMFMLYKVFTYAKLGNLGPGNSIPIPTCAEVINNQRDVSG
jgi:hypothetical protein